MRVAAEREVGRKERRRVANCAGFVPQLVAAARKNFVDEAEIRVAALVAWAALAGIVGWTPTMVTTIEREMAR